MKVAVDRDRCIGAGMCVLTAPDIFDQDPAEAVVVLLDESPGVEKRALVEQAVERCPAAVITLDDESP